MDLSLIIPCHNAHGKIGRCLASLRQIDLSPERYEVIFVDDHSTDGTDALLADECAGEANWRLIRLAENSGSPSEPRNRGTHAALGTYVFYLDCDDEILPDTPRVHLEHAIRHDADLVRGYLIAEMGDRRLVMNRMPEWSDDFSLSQRASCIIQEQSTVCCSLVKRRVIIENDILWRSDIRMGEDTLFLCQVLSFSKVIEYIDHPTFIYVKTPNFAPSSTQSYGNRELRDHLMVWRGAIEALKPFGIDYAALRLHVGLRTALRSLIFLNRGDISRTVFESLSSFLCEHRETIDGFPLSARLKEIIAIAQSSSFTDFSLAIRPRLLIAGYDLKFMTGIIPQLEAFYDVRIDTWLAQDHHDEAASQKALEWAELIWCEWLLGNAVWYSRNKLPHQILIIRMHRFELDRSFGSQINIGRVDAIVAVSALFFERLLERFPHIPRQKVRLLHNYVDTESYTPARGEGRHFRLAMIGILPARKGFDRALSILAKLREHDPRYTLDVFGHEPGEVPWLANDRQEMEYFRQCEALIEQYGLAPVVRYQGHADIKSALAQHDIGIVLSVSHSQREFPCSESFHLAVADGFAAGSVGLICYWEGAEFIWPERFILASDDDIIQRILEYRRDVSLYREDAEAGRDFVANTYGVKSFIESFQTMFRQSVST